MPGRKFSSGSGYRYGFNGQEKTIELNENMTTALYWEYDSRIARRWNTDPEKKDWFAPYLTFANNPIIYVDPLGNTDFYTNGTWIGTDGVNNGLLAIVNDKSVAVDIRKHTKDGTYAKYGKLENGQHTSQFSVIHKDVLTVANERLNKAISTKTNKTTEHLAVLKEKVDGGYATTFTASAGNSAVASSGESGWVQGTATPEGDVRIHSHILAVTNVEKQEIVNGRPTGRTATTTTSYNAQVPSECDPNIGGDKCTDINYKMNIIVGYNGKAGEGPYKVTIDPNTNKVTYRETRKLNINVFGSDSQLKFSISQSDARNMLQNAANDKAKNDFIKNKKTEPQGP